MKIIFIITLLFLLIGCTGGPYYPEFVFNQHQNGASHSLSNEDTQFTFIGTLKSVSDKSHLNAHGEEWAITLDVEKLLIGKYEEESVHIGTTEENDSTFELGKKYYITVDWGMHGFLLMGYSKID